MFNLSEINKIHIANASVLGINWEGNYRLNGEDVLSAALDIVGVVDPTGAADGINAILQAQKGDWGDALISSAGLLRVSRKTQ